MQRIVPVDFKKFSDTVSKEVVEKTAYNKLNTKINNLENKIPNATTLFHINQCNTEFVEKNGHKTSMGIVAME